MEFEKFTERSRGFVQSAQALALREGHQRFTPEHLLKVLLDDEEGLAANLIQAAGGDSRLALRDIEAARERIKKQTYGLCVDCGDEVDYKRLAVYPTAKRCMRCQQQRERTYAQPGRPSL